MNTTTDPGKYLGLPLVHGRQAKAHFQNTIDKINVLGSSFMEN